MYMCIYIYIYIYIYNEVLKCQNRDCRNIKNLQNSRENICAGIAFSINFPPVGLQLY